MCHSFLCTTPFEASHLRDLDGSSRDIPDIEISILFLIWAKATHKGRNLLSLRHFLFYGYPPKRCLPLKRWLQSLQKCPFILKELDTPRRFSAILIRGITLLTSCLASYTPNPFWQVVHSKRKEFAPKGSKFLPLRVDLYSEGMVHSKTK